MRKIRIVVCDDIETERERYTVYCREFSKKHKIDIEMKSYNGGNDLLLDLENPKFYTTLDILFLDINMPGINGVETAQKAREIGYAGIIVFITVSKEHYEKAFDVRAFNYVRKGEHNEKRFEEVFLKAIKAAEDMRQEVIVLSGGGELRQIEVREIEYIEVVKRVMTIYYNGQTFEFISTLEKLENQLFNHGFQRVHRNYLVSLSHVKSISYEEITMLDEKKLPVGRKYYNDLKAAIEKIKMQ